MELLELWRDTAIQDGFEKGRSLDEISQETGLPVRDVVARVKELRLIPRGAGNRKIPPSKPGPRPGIGL
jgi:hypothetical protein